MVGVTSGPTGVPSGAKKSPLTPASTRAVPDGVISVTDLRARVTPSPSTAGTTRKPTSQRPRSADTRWMAHGPSPDHAKW